MKPNILNILSKININKILTNTSKTLNIVKKTIPIYKEIKRPKPETKLKESNQLPKKYNDNLTFFH